MLAVTHLKKGFQSEGAVVKATDDVTFHVEQGEFFTLLGPSGCGKSTILRCVAGLETIDDGEIAIDGRLVASRSIHIDANRRPIAMVFQSYAIWPHMTVLENVTFPLAYRGSKDGSRLLKKDRRERGMEALRLVQLDHLASRRAPYLSGGQQQRVALARSLVVRPKLLLLDEPLSNLDAKLREEMRWEIKELTRTLAICTIYVTHDQGEALSMSDRIAVLADGQIRQIGSPKEIYLTPVSGQVARIVGSVNVLKGDVVRQVGDLVEVKLGSGKVIRCRHGGSAEGEVGVIFRPELVEVNRIAEGEPDPPESIDQTENRLRAVVRSAVFSGDHIQCQCETADGVISAKLSPDAVVVVGKEVVAVVKVENCITA